MAKTITLDKVDVQRVLLMKDGSGSIQVFAEYTLGAGTQVVQYKQDQIQAKLTGSRRAAATALFDAIAQDVSAIELA